MVLVKWFVVHFYALIQFEVFALLAEEALLLMVKRELSLGNRLEKTSKLSLLLSWLLLDLETVAIK